MKRALVSFLLACLLLTGCGENESETITTDGKTVNATDDTCISLNKGWFVTGYDVDYENKVVIIKISKDYEN